MLAKLRPVNRMKPRTARAPTAAERRHLNRVAAEGCLVCGADAEIHHVKVPGRIGNRDHRFVAPLCPEHHRGNTGIHGLGSDHLFEVMHDINLKEWAVTAWEASEEMADA